MTNGWKNQESYLVALWLDNDEFLYRGCVDLAETAKNTPHPVAFLTKSLQQYIRDLAPQLNGLFGDLLAASIESVDWEEIAYYLLDEG